MRGGEGWLRRLGSRVGVAMGIREGKLLVGCHYSERGGREGGREGERERQRGDEREELREREMRERCSVIPGCLAW